MLKGYKDEKLIQAIQRNAHELTGAPTDYDALLQQVGDASLVLLGEATHGTHEFYRARAEISKRLIMEKGFNVVAVEADWPDAYRINRYIQGRGESDSAVEALRDFRRFPTWMWRNADVLDFIGWLREHNDSLVIKNKVGFYGLDLYSLYSSIEAVINYLQQMDPDAAQRARQRYACFDHFGENAQAYGYSVSSELTESCEPEVVEQLAEMRRQAELYLNRDGYLAEDELFYAEQNARIAQNAEEYYRNLYTERESSWNLRDTHMMNTLDALITHVGRDGRSAKVIVWEHNSHLGDARATEMSKRGELNVGQLVRQKYGKKAVLVGFTTYAGTVTASYDWGEPPRRERIREALAESYEALFHDTEIPAFSLNLVDADEAISELNKSRLERAIGVIYRPKTERWSHYFYARLAEQFDTVVHFDNTRAVEPLDRNPEWEHEELPETYPTGL